jgi:GH35 family endo-1,4-beta-xylanase
MRAFLVLAGATVALAPGVAARPTAGLKDISELDINLLPNVAPATRGQPPSPALNPYVNGLPDDVRQALTERYADAFGVFLKHRDDIARITFWGVSDAVAKALLEK